MGHGAGMAQGLGHLETTGCLPELHFGALRPQAPLMWGLGPTVGCSHDEGGSRASLLLLQGRVLELRDRERVCEDSEGDEGEAWGAGGKAIRKQSPPPPVSSTTTEFQPQRQLEIPQWPHF